MEKRLSKQQEDMIRVYRGLIPWSVAEHDWIVAAFDQRRQNKNEKLEATDEFPGLKEQMKNLKGRELENMRHMILFSDIFHKRYPDEIQYQAHFQRFNQINRFMQTYHNEFVKLKLVTVQGAKPCIAFQLVETLCTIEYSQEEDFDQPESFGAAFSYPEVVAITQAKINAHLN